MKRLLICPSPRPEVASLAVAGPLATAPLLGQGLLEYWLSHLAGAGLKEAIILADDRPDYIRAVAGNGERWGISVNVIEESRELSPSQALLKYESEFGAAQNNIILLDRLPTQPDTPLFTSYRDWFRAVVAWMPHSKTPDRVGVHKLRPGVWAGSNWHISPKAELRPPCWLGKNVFVGPGAVVGPEAVIENGAFIDRTAMVSHGIVGPDTFIGRFTEITGVFAWGDTLVQLDTGCAVKVADPFLMCALRRPRAPQLQPAGFLTRLLELCSRNKTDAHLLWKQFLHPLERH